jgi:hypothetical protein
MTNVHTRHRLLIEAVSAKALKDVKRLSKYVQEYFETLNSYSAFELSGEMRAKYEDVVRDILNDDKFDSGLYEDIKYLYKVIETYHKLLISTVKISTELLDDDEIDENKNNTVAQALVNVVRQDKNVPENKARDYVINMIMKLYFQRSTKKVSSSPWLDAQFNAAISLTFQELETITKLSLNTLKKIKELIEPTAAAVKEIEKTEEPSATTPPEAPKEETPKDNVDRLPTAQAPVSTSDAIDTVVSFLNKIDKNSRRKVALAALKRATA